ncbi:LysR family transcriptional regulator [Dasania marina]|uniref:LysR family transcriptional regulator n=1 Tax=Dasania marina TaxID=471499 RepID=UPI0030DB64B4|tara:strand:- start:8643 stop:9593 length:951 start_codon:yes stop_codon:yes gene_type:complete
MSSRIPLSDIDFRLLRVFKAVAECGGYGGAELELNINRSTISTHMSDLETRLGMKLCHRGRGRTAFSLTEQGAEVYEALTVLFDDINSFRNRVTSIRSELTGKLRIALPDDWLQFTQMDLAPAIAGFREKAPLVELEVLAHAANEIDFDLLNNRADLAVNVIHRAHIGLVPEFLYSHHNSLYCGDKHPLFLQKKIDVESLVEHELVGASHVVSEVIHRIYEMFSRRAVANHMSGRTLMILSGCYVGFLPDYYAQRWVDSGQLKRLNVSEFDYDIDNCVLYRKGGRENPLIDLFVSEIFLQLNRGSNQTTNNVVFKR